MRAPAIVAALVVVAAGLAGCGERGAATTFKQGVYQGKPDTEPWRGEMFKGDKLAWERAIKDRARGQNEYERTAN